jgi:hypothetical protein
MIRSLLKVPQTIPSSRKERKERKERILTIYILDNQPSSAAQ